MNKIERKRVKRAKATLNAEIDRLTLQLNSALEQLRLARHAAHAAEAELEEWRKKLQAIHRHIAVLPPEHNDKYAGPRYPERRLPEIRLADDVSRLSVRMLSMAELYLEMRRDVLKWQRYFHFTAHTPPGTTRRLAYCVSEHMWQLMADGRIGEDAFCRDVVNTMYKKCLQNTD